VLRRSGDVLLIAGAVLLYFLVRGLVDGREAEAYRHAEQLIDLERAIGVFWEPTIQRWALDVGPVGRWRTGSTSGGIGPSSSPRLFGS
jgi:hypothetical protein